MKCFPPNWRGSQVRVTIEGNFYRGVGQAYRTRILRYMQRLAIITPYAFFRFIFLGSTEDDDKKNMRVHYNRRIDTMPPIPCEVQHHPSSVDLVVANKLIRQRPRASLESYLRKSFSGINKAKAGAIIAGLGRRFDKDEYVGEMSVDKVKHVVKYLTDQTDWRPPKSDALSPAGEYLLYLGIAKEADPDLIATHTSEPGVYQGHAFIVEAAVSLGGNKSMSTGYNIFRFANRIPLMFEEGSDVITKTAKDSIKWGNYKIDKSTDRIGVYVSIVSTKIPFKGTGKEFISDDIPVIKRAVKETLQRCCQQLKSSIAKKQQAKANNTRKKELLKYSESVCKSIFGVLKLAAAEVRGASAAAAAAAAGHKRKRGEDWTPEEKEEEAAEEEFLERIRSKGVTKATLKARLEAFVDLHAETEAQNYANMTTGAGGAAAAAAAGGGSIDKFFVPTKHMGESYALKAPLFTLTLLPAANTVH